MKRPYDLPSRFQIGDEVVAGSFDGGEPGIVSGVYFKVTTVSYDVMFEDGKSRRMQSGKVHPKDKGNDAEVADVVLALA